MYYEIKLLKNIEEDYQDEYVAKEDEYYIDPDDIMEDDTIDFEEFHLEDADYMLIDEIHDSYRHNKNIAKERQELIDTLNINSFEANTIMISYLGYDKDEVLSLPFETEIN